MFYKVKKIKSIDGMCNAVDKCKGKVEVHTADSDVLNLKSELSRLITINVILNGMTKIEDIKMLISNPDDAELIKNYVEFE